MPPRRRRVDPALGLIVAVACLSAHAAAAQNVPASTPGTSNLGTLQTFDLAKPAEVKLSTGRRSPAIVPPKSPARSESLRTTIGLGYVQGADWGAEFLAGGTFAGAQVHLNSLVTRGSEGLLFDHGTMSIFHPDTQWRVEAGDVFSHLRGLSFGGRFSWAAGRRRPAIGIYASRRGLPDRPLVLSYRDQIRIGEQTLLDAEVATDRSYLLRSRLTAGRVDIDASYRSLREPYRSRDMSLSGSVRLWRGITVNGGLFDSEQGGDRGEWRLLALRLPVTRHLDFTLERAFTGGTGIAHSTSAVMATVAAGDLRFFHRYQQGQFDFAGSGFAGSIERRQTQSMTSYSPGPRLNLSLQLATQRSDTGPAQHWEELQATMRLTSTTTVRAVTGVPDVRNPDRFQAYVRQELPKRFALQADYGPLSTYQPVLRELDRSRFKLMLFKTVDIATPARGALVAGRVLDDAGRGVRGARVRLGPYSADADADGAYSFRHVPRGEYELSLDPEFLPADFAWDGRGDRLVIESDRAVRADLRVTPLNAIHGRLYVDLDGDGRFDANEAVSGAVIRVGDRLTMTDAAGTYSVYNLWPGPYLVRIERLPSAYEAAAAERSIVLRDGEPSTGVDFVVRPRVKPVIWDGGR